MSTSAVSGSSIFQELQSFYQTRQSDLKQLGSALQSGDLAGAQQAYSALAALGQDGPFANSATFSKSNRAQAFDAIGQALQAGDLAGAQAAFTTLKGSTSNPTNAGDATIVNLGATQAGSSTATDGTSSIFQQLQAFQHQRKADLAQLGQALQSGDLAGAQTAFDALTALGASGPSKNGQPFQQAGRASDFQAIGQALQSGDLAGAQSAFTTLAATLGGHNQQTQSAITAYSGSAPEIVVNFLSSLSSPPTSTSSSGVSTTQTPPKEPPVSAPPSSFNGSGPQGVPALVVNLGPSSGSSSSPESVTINVSNSNSGEQVSISESQGQTGSAAEQVTLNLSQHNNYELVLNLFNSGSAGQAQSASSNAISLQA
jgi:hypothetical protein